MADERKSTRGTKAGAAAKGRASGIPCAPLGADGRRSGAELVAALRRLGALGLEIEPDKRCEPLSVDFDATP
jgi:hypothetical protein